MNDLSQLVGLAMLLFFGMPILVYVCVKMGTVGYYNGRRYIERKKDHEQEIGQNGATKTSERPPASRGA